MIRLIFYSFIAFVVLPNIVKAQSSDVKSFAQYEDLLAHLDQDEGLQIINFWATWCGPCVKELPHFNQFAEEYEDKVTVYFVSLDFTNQFDKRLVPFVKKHEWSGEVLHLGDTQAHVWINKVNKGWSGAIPATWIRRKGETEAFIEDSFESVEELKHAVNPYLPRGH